LIHEKSNYVSAMVTLVSLALLQNKRIQNNIQQKKKKKEIQRQNRA